MHLIASVLVCWNEIIQILFKKLKVTVYQNVHAMCQNSPDGDGCCCWWQCSPYLQSATRCSAMIVIRNLVTLRDAGTHNIFHPKSFKVPYFDSLKHPNNSTGFMEMSCCSAAAASLCKFSSSS